MNEKHHFDRDMMRMLLQIQRNEITEYHIYSRLAELVGDDHNRKVLDRIADHELKHYEFWKTHTERDVRPDRLKIKRYVWLAKLLGLTFGIKLMERGEKEAQQNYERVASRFPAAQQIMDDENRHEDDLIDLLNEESLRYVGSVVLGLNDALVELTGVLAGLTLALQDTNLIAMTGLVTGIAASLSMGASEYLSTKSEETRRAPLKAATYTGIAYLVTVMLLIFPFFLISNYLIALVLTLINASIIIFAFTFYISVARDEVFRRRFLEMAAISFGVALLSFGIGYLVREVFGVDI
jgi:vacuolar iron transporter family protein